MMPKSLQDWRGFEGILGVFFFFFMGYSDLCKLIANDDEWARF
jgi:hypothetical protein